MDANGGYTRKQAIRVAGAMAEHDVTWFEEPVSSDDLDGLRKVRDQVRPDVTAGEYGYDLVYLARMVAAQAVDCLQVGVTRCGGITEWLPVAHGDQPEEAERIPQQDQGKGRPAVYPGRPPL